MRTGSYVLSPCHRCILFKLLHIFLCFKKIAWFILSAFNCRTCVNELIKINCIIVYGVCCVVWNVMSTHVHNLVHVFVFQFLWSRRWQWRFIVNHNARFSHAYGIKWQLHLFYLSIISLHWSNVVAFFASVICFISCIFCLHIMIARLRVLEYS